MGWTCTFDAELWEWEAAPEATSWVFVTVPPDETEEIQLRSGPPRGFGGPGHHQPERLPLRPAWAVCQSGRG